MFRTLRTNIQFMNTKGKLKTILVTSTLPGEGKSWVSSNLAVTFAQAGKKVVIIDADMRKGRQYTIFGVSPRPGLSNYLSGVLDGEEINEDLSNYIQETEVENLYVISAGNIPPNPSELLIAPQMVNLLDQLKEMCDIIIIDGTPSQLVTDSLILTRLVDSTIIVTAQKYTKKEDLKRVITNIQNVGGKIAGVVVNKVTMSAKKYEQSYYYGSTSMRNTKPSSRSTQARRNNAQMYNRTSNLLKNNTQSSTKRNENTENKPKSNSTKQKPKTLNREIKIENKEEISIEKTNDILNQINQYLDEEKKKLN
ncbi:MAG: CpsD/CapB family tyrosine-protein kinase [Clostridia bacterium]